MPDLLLRNLSLLDTEAGELRTGHEILVRDKRIAAVERGSIAAGDAQVIDLGGRTVMPGLIDCHVHLNRTILPTAPLMLPSLLTAHAGATLEGMLMRGFTTVRDLGGPAFALKRAIDDGVVAGPRIFPAGAMITVTSGHGDFRQMYELPRQLGGPPARMESLGAAMVADSPDEVRVRVREQLMLGASQIKLTAGGGVSSPHSPLDVSTFTEAELRAAVEAAENWGTYVTVHAYTPAAIRRAIAAGVRVIEHAHLMDEATAQLMAEKGVWLSTQPFAEEIAATFPPGSEQAIKAREVRDGTERVYALAKKYRIKTAFGTDILFSRSLAQSQGAFVVRLTRWYTPAEALVMATGTNAELLALSGKRSPYTGKLGVVEEGAFADLLLVDGDPVANIALLADPAKNLLVIMKDGRVYKNTLVR